MQKDDRLLGSGWSKKLKTEFYKKFGVEIKIEYLYSLLVKTIFIYMVDGKIIYAMDNVSVRSISFLVQKSLKEGKNLLIEAIERYKEQVEFTKKHLTSEAEEKEAGD